MDKISIGDTGLSVTSLGIGASALGDMPETYGYSVGEESARETLHAIFDGPVNFLDTSNNYGFGRSEERIGAALRERGGMPEGFVISTKLDRDLDTGRFDAVRVRQSVEESLSRLGLDQIPLLHLHDPEHARDLKEITQTGGAIDELFRLKEEGIAQAVGLAMGRVDMMLPILREHPFDALISHNRFSLLNKSAQEMFDYAHSAGIAVFNAAPYAGGVLAKGSEEMPRITYQLTDHAGLEPVRRIEEICGRHEIPPGAVALQFSMREPKVSSTIVGVSRLKHIQETFDWSGLEIPSRAWDELMALPYSGEDPEANRDYKPG
ncbi:MAG: aldo/keto reductase [Rhizobiaceae bacterium]